MKLLLISLIGLIFSSCSCEDGIHSDNSEIMIEAESFLDSFGAFTIKEGFENDIIVTALDKPEWLAYEVQVDIPGRYRCEIRLSSESNAPGSCWIEDYYDNTEDRTYNITAEMRIPATRKGGVYSVISKDGSPLNTGLHRMKLHIESDSVNVDWIKFILMKRHQFTPDTLVQNMDGSDWQLVWSDEFDGTGIPDTSKWTFDIGNWGWGNFETQYYTENRIENARQENGMLVIEARKNDLNQPWTSARLTSRGKVSFVYGKIEFRAMVPAGDGAWSAAWLLGDAYRDEKSWPLCGEFDIIECTGREIDDKTGNGINHASSHSLAYYFKKGNQIKNTIEVTNMSGTFHTYGIQWTRNKIDAFVDGEKYLTYDKSNSEKEWPFNNPQNLIINVAMGGFMGGDIDPSLDSQKFVIDYVRVFGKK